MTSMNRRAFTRVLLAAGLTAAVRTQAENAPDGLRIGYQKSSTLITLLLKTRGALERALAPFGLRLSWHEFASGLPLTEALNVGAVDFSADVADTVPVFAQAAHARFVYVAQEAPSPKAQAIVVKQDGALRTLADLRASALRSRQPAAITCCLPRSLARSSGRCDDPLPDARGRSRGVRARQRGRVDHVGSLCRVGRPESRRADSGRRQRTRVVPALLPRIQQFRRRAARRRPDPVRPVVAGGHMAARPPAGGREYPRADLGLDATTIARANARRSYLVRAVASQNFGEQQQIADTFPPDCCPPASIEPRAGISLRNGGTDWCEWPFSEGR